MSKRTQQFQTIRSEGALLPPDVLQLIASLKTDGTSAEAYHLPPGTKINEAISQSWNALRQHWTSFQEARKGLGKGAETETGTSVTNSTWLLPLFKELDYGRLMTAKSPVIDDRTYPIERFYNHTPIHLVGCQISLDRRTRGARGAATASPHSMVQEFLNRSKDHLWAFVSNGLQLRIMRDNISLSRQAFIEFDLESMMDGEVYSDFALLWLLCHQSRVESEKPTDSWLEKWSKLARDQGTRVLEGLRNGVAAAIEALGQGFIGHPQNDGLRERLRSGELTKDDYYRQLLRVVYRLLFLFVAEDRELLHPPMPNQSAEGNDVKAEKARSARSLYDEYYSTRRLRDLSFRVRGSKHSDLWHSLSIVFHALGNPAGCPQLALSGLGSFLWRDSSTSDLLGPFPNSQLQAPNSYSLISNEDLLRAVRSLAFIEQDRVLRVVDYRNLGSEELGSVYESLLELHPQVHIEAKGFELKTAAGNERKTSGSYYTPDSLVQCLLDSALEPVVAERIAEARELAQLKHKNDADKLEILKTFARALDNNTEMAKAIWNQVEDKGSERIVSSVSFEKSIELVPVAQRQQLLAESAILNLKVCDPASGSGHFLIAAAHRLARHLARVRTGEAEPTPDEYQSALRDIIGRCIYGVDINPMAVELCKVSLWMEAIEPGKPLSFLDHHIQCGNSLLGTTPKLLAQGIPNEAFAAIEGDDKKVVKSLKADNKRERDDRASGQLSFFETFFPLGNLPSVFANLNIANDDTVDDVLAVEKRYSEAVSGAEYANARLLADTWCAAFVWKKDDSELGKLCPTERDFRKIESYAVAGLLPYVRAEVERMRDQFQFFHWHLAFPDVFRLPGKDERPENEQTGWSGGFDLVVGNPPWERVKLQEKEWFAERSTEIANAPNAAARKRLIDGLRTGHPELHAQFLDAVRQSEGESFLLRQSGRYPLCGRGDINVYTVFAETMRQILNSAGRAGCVLPSGIATDDTTKYFFQDVVETRSLISLFDFENRDAIFSGVHRSYKFCLFTAGSGLRPACEQATFVFFAHRTEHVADPDRRFTLSPEDIGLLNPNTRTCPIFRSRRDAELTKAIYRRMPVLIREAQGNRPEENPWGIKFSTMFHMSNDSQLFRTREQLEADGWELRGNTFVQNGERFLPLYEAKLFHQFDHRFATFEGGSNGSETTRNMTDAEKADASSVVQPRYWVSSTFFSETQYRG